MGMPGVVDRHPLLQMVAYELKPAEHSVPVRDLSPADLPAMGRLIDAAKPGPLLPGYHELCTVCSHPDVRGRGCAKLVSSVIARAMSSYRSL